MTGWEQLAAFDGGTVTSLATATAADGTQHAFAATPVGVFRSVDRGLRWSPLGGASRVAGVDVVAASPRYAEDGIVFAGAYDGLFRWREGGAEWEHLLSGSRVLALACTPGGGAGLTLLAGTETDGVLRSRDGGRTWEGANPGLLDLEIVALAVSPTFDDGVAFAATPSGLYRTRNGAESWREVELEQEDATIQCLAVSPNFAEDRVILAGTEDHGLLRSDDAGRSWEQAPGLQSRMVNSLFFLEGGRVVAGTDAGLALSDDAGASWRIVGEDLGGIGGAVLLREGDAGVLLAGLPETGVPQVPGLPHTGIARSVDDGQTWTAANDGLAARLLVELTLSPASEGNQTIVVTSLDAGIQVSHDGGRTWAAHGDSQDDDTPLEELLSAPFEQAEIVTLARSPGYARDGTTFVATTGASKQAGSGGPVVWRTTDRGRRWDRWFEEPMAPGIGPARIVALPSNRWGDTVVLGLGGSVYRPRQNAWEVRGGARRPVWDAVALPGQEATGRLPAIAGLVASPEYAQDRTLFAATSAGVYVSRDGGASFAAWNDGLEPAATVAVAPSPGYARDRLVYALGLGGTIWRRRDG